MKSAVTFRNGGIIRRTAWGNTMRPIPCQNDIPSDRADSIWPRSTDWIPAR